MCRAAQSSAISGNMSQRLTKLLQLLQLCCAPQMAQQPCEPAHKGNMDSMEGHIKWLINAEMIIKRAEHMHRAQGHGWSGTLPGRSRLLWAGGPPPHGGA